MPKDDPVYLNSRREAILILTVWACCVIYTVGYCYWNGYLSHESGPNTTGPALGAMVGTLESLNRDPESLTTPLGLGIPDWVFWGICMPWLFCIVFTFWFCLCYFKTDDLGPEMESPEEEVQSDA